MKLKELSVSWLLHSIKILLGDEDIRRYIILQKFPNLKHKFKKDIRTFDPFVKKRKTRQDKHNEIEKYLEHIITLTDIVVFTATNVQQNDKDNETHYQSFIVDNDNKIAYVIDPAFDKNDDKFIGIYYAEITHDVIKPFLESNGYTVKFIHLERPAQSTTNDVFCQSWSLLILLEILENNKYQDNNLEFKIPKTKVARYKKILDFYKNIFESMSELQANLQEEYNGSINDCNYDNCPTEEQKHKLLAINAYELLKSMKDSDM
jgi:hypothetical protein